MAWGRDGPCLGVGTSPPQRTCDTCYCSETDNPLNTMCAHACTAGLQRRSSPLPEAARDLTPAAWQALHWLLGRPGISLRARAAYPDSSTSWYATRNSPMMARSGDTSAMPYTGAMPPAAPAPPLAASATHARRSCRRRTMPSGGRANAHLDDRACPPRRREPRPPRPRTRAGPTKRRWARQQVS